MKLEQALPKQCKQSKEGHPLGLAQFTLGHAREQLHK